MSSEAQAAPPETTHLDLAGDTLATEPQAVADYHQRFVLNNADRDHLLQALASEEGPNAALVQAMRRFDERYEKQ